MTFCTPMIGKVARAIFNQANPNIIKLMCAEILHSADFLSLQG